MFKRITVSQRSIREGTPDDCSTCPVALALKKAFKGRVNDVNVDDKFICLDIDGDYVVVKSPRSVTRFVKAFDEGRNVRSFSFNLKFNENMIGQTDQPTL
jgi:hypothetical protein